MQHITCDLLIMLSRCTILAEEVLHTAHSIACSSRNLLRVAPHCTRQELDLMHLWRGLSPQKVRERLEARRDKTGIGTANIKQVRKTLAGKTFKRGAAETRGVKPKLSKTNVCCSRMLRR